MPFGDARARAVRAEARSVFRRASSIDGVTWRTSSSKNVGMFQNETKSCGTTNVPGRNGSFRDPTEDVARIRSAPASFNAHRFARWFTRCGGTRWAGPWRARNATRTSPWRARPTEGARGRTFVRRQGEEAREGTRALPESRREGVPPPVDHPPASEPRAEGAPRSRPPGDLAVHDPREGLHRPAQPERPHERDPHAHRGRRQVRGPPRRSRVPDDQQRPAADLEIPRVSERGRRPDRGNPPGIRGRS